ncbi:hypothetical protein [Bradyrhizobium sp.]|uniref:hypothetical protein n=1 Tax=Bradyrhizobium sp. TaxID=376 RepID=UPI0040384DBB
MMAQAEQQIAKIAALDQQIAQKDAEADSIKASIEKLEAGLPYLADTADIRRKAMQIEFGNRIAHLDAQYRLSDQRHELVTQRRRAVEVEAARKALEASREQTRAEYARGIVTDLAEAEQKAAQTAQELIKAEKKMQDQVLPRPDGRHYPAARDSHHRRGGDTGPGADGRGSGRREDRSRGDGAQQRHRLRP